MKLLTLVCCASAVLCQARLNTMVLSHFSIPPLTFLLLVCTVQVFLWPTFSGDVSLINLGTDRPVKTSFDCRKLSARLVAKHHDLSTAPDGQRHTFLQRKTPYFLIPSLLKVAKDAAGYEVFKSVNAALPQTNQDVQSMTPINTGQLFCSVAKGNSLSVQCSAVGTLSTVLTCTQTVPCKQSSVNTPVPNITIPRIFLDREFDPSAKNAAKIITQERVSYYWLFKSIVLTKESALKIACNPGYWELNVLPGWTLLHTVNMYAPSSAVYFPYATIASRPSDSSAKTQDILVSIRGSQTQDDWGINFLYNQAQAESLGESVAVHRGYLFIATRILEPLKEILARAVAQDTLGQVTITGHSLGAGIASILGLQVANALPRLKSHSLYKTPPERPQVVLFGAPYVGNAEFSRQLKEKTIVRSITTTYDPVSFLPCKKGMPVCDAESVPVPTGETVKPLDAYADMPNVVMIQPGELPEVWSLPGASLRFLAWHSCAYHCWLSLGLGNQPPEQCFAPLAKGSTNASQCHSLTLVTWA